MPKEMATKFINFKPERGDLVEVVDLLPGDYTHMYKHYIGCKGRMILVINELSVCFDEELVKNPKKICPLEQRSTGCDICKGLRCSVVNFVLKKVIRDIPVIQNKYTRRIKI